MLTRHFFKWCWKCGNEKIQKLVEVLYNCDMFEVILMECMECHSHNKTILNKGGVK